VELLVVIGIIALLVAILLPALNNARNQARTVQCASNLRQIAMAITAYASSNNGRLPPSVVNSGDTVYPLGFCWCNELVSQKYLTAPAGMDASGHAILLSDSVFRCPMGSYEPIGSSGFSAMSPRDAINEQYSILGYPTSADGVGTWYALNSITTEAASVTSSIPGGPNDAPFAWYNGKTAGETDLLLRNNQFTRTMSLVREASELVMAFDGNTYNWNDIAGSTGLSARISGRHGKPTNGGLDGNFNAAFFDGHVELLSTQPITLAGTGTNALDVMKPQVVFWLHDQ
jgi:prepilin-type processing-associated H-X9-DG protein